MSIVDSASAITQAEYLLGVSAALITADGKSQAVTQALSELNTNLPATDDKLCYWIIERVKRHMLYIVMVEQAYKFRYKEIYLQQRFDSHFKMISAMDKTFAAALESDSSLVLAGLDLDSVAEFGFMANPAGFVYDQIGRDYTYVD